MSRTRHNKQNQTQRPTADHLPPAPGEPGSPEAEAAIIEDGMVAVEAWPQVPPQVPVTGEPHMQITMVIPLAAPISGSMTHRVHIDGHLRGENGATMIRLRNALDYGNYRLVNGKHVHTYRDVVNWLMESVIASEESR